MQRIFQSALAKRSLFLAAVCLLLTSCPAFAKDSREKNPLFSLRHDGRVRTYLVHLPASYSKDKAWPGGTKWALWADEPSREISATDVIWEFFEDHPRRN